MNADVKALWVAALRSGDYTQGYSRLADGHKRCCLGVLCDLAKAEGVIRSYTANMVGLPGIVRNWAGLPETFGAFVVINGKRDPLTDQNDGNRCTFAQIADAIETQL